MFLSVFAFGVQWSTNDDKSSGLPPRPPSVASDCSGSTAVDISPSPERRRSGVELYHIPNANLAAKLALTYTAFYRLRGLAPASWL